MKSVPVLKWYLEKIDIKLLQRISFRHSSLMLQSTCSNNHLYKTTTRLRWPLLGLPKQILIQLLLYKMTTCLMQSATTFFVSQMKKYLSKTTTTKLYQAQKRETNLEQQCIKNLWLDLLYCPFIKLCLMSLFNVCKNWTINKNYIEIFKIM